MNFDSRTDAGAPPASLSPRILAAGAIGNALEWYDFTVYGFFATVFAKNFFPEATPFIGLLSAFGVFAASFLMRPLGALVFGHVADRFGRARALVLSAVLMTGSTVAIGLLPTYATAGAAAPLLLLAMRLLQGVCIGGEYPTSGVFLAENAAPGRRGFATSFSGVGVAAGTLVGSAIAAAISGLLSPEALIAWGWRVPFLCGLALGGFAFYLRRAMAVEPVAQPGERRAPVLDMVREDGANAVRAVIIAFQAGVVFYLVFVYLSTYLQQEDGVAASFALGLNTASLLVTLVLVVAFGALSDRVGRKPVLMSGLLGIAVLSWPLFLLISTGGTAAIIGAQMVFAVLIPLASAPLACTMAEMFPRARRCTAVALCWGVGVGLGGGTAPLVATFLVGGLGSRMAPAAYLALVSLMAAAALATVRDRYRAPLDAPSMPPASRRGA